MEMRDLLEKMMKFAGEKVGQKPGEQWRGSDKAPPGKKLVGDSILKDLSKGPKAKTREQELAEEFQAFLEAEFKDTVDKRPARKNARPARGHEPEPRYKTVKTDEAVGQEYTVIIDRKGREKPVSGTIEELLDYFGYTLEVGKSYEHERGRYKINMAPKNVVQLVDALNKAVTNAAANSAPSTYYSVGKSQVAEGVPYKATNPHPASKDPIVAKVLKQMRPGLTGLEMNNEAFLYFAYEIGKMRAREMWEDYGPAIRYFYQSGIGVNEGWESGPEEYQEPYDDADDAYDRRRQEKLDIEAEKEQAKRPQEKVYTLLGRGPNMEPNYKFPGEYKSQEDAIAARKRIMADPNTPHPEHIGIHSYTRYLDQANENSVTTPKNPAHAKQMQQDLGKLQTEVPNPDPELAATIARRKDILMKQAKDLGIDESRAHKILDKWFKDRELQDKFARGELNIPTPQERRAELEKSKAKDKKQVKEYGADQPTGTAAPGKTVNDPKQAQQVAANLNIQKNALSQLKQINPEIDPVKAASAMTKDTATMSPQEKDELAQVAKTVSPALGTPAFGSLKTAIQKSQVK